MRIASAQVQMASTHRSTTRRQVEERLTVVAPAPVAPGSVGRGDSVSLSGAAAPPATPARAPVGGLLLGMSPLLRPLGADGLRTASRPHGPSGTTTHGPSGTATHGPGGGKSIAQSNPEGGDAGAPTEDLKTALVRALFERLTGRKMEIGDLEKSLARIHSEAPGAEVSITGPDAALSRLGEVTAIRFERIERTEEAETTAFSARAVVTTAEGETLEIGVDMVLSRQFIEENRLQLDVARGQSGPGAGSAPKTKDPLVINFDAGAAALTEGTTAFDLDSDGETDNIHFVGEGSGFMALDLNGNGAVDDGSELFGATTGDGFAELAAYDDDQNGWIDENDAVFNALRIWSKDAEGRDTLATLKERNVGALYLGNVNAAYAYRDQANQSVAQMRSAGFFVGEVGHRAGSMQQLDLVV